MATNINGYPPVGYDAAHAPQDASMMPMDDQMHSDEHKHHDHKKDAGKHYSKHEILECFATHDLMDELEECRKYFRYAESLRDSGHPELASQVSQMAYEEFTHAKFQKMVLDRAGYPVDMETLDMYHKVESRMKGMFR